MQTTNARATVIAMINASAKAEAISQVSGAALDADAHGYLANWAHDALEIGSTLRYTGETPDGARWTVDVV